jgi:hypothetical protein
VSILKAGYIVYKYCCNKKVKQSHNTPMEAQGGEEVYGVYLSLIHDLGTRWR